MVLTPLGTLEIIGVYDTRYILRQSVADDTRDRKEFAFRDFRLTLR